MAARVEPIFHLPFFVSNEDMSPLEYCHSLTFLPDKDSLGPDAPKNWRGKPWGHTRKSPIRPANARELHYGSTPDFDIDFSNLNGPFYFNNINGPPQPKTESGVISSGSPKPDSPADSNRKILDKGFSSIRYFDFRSLKFANAKLIGPNKVSKFAKFFPSSESQGETMADKPSDESSHTVTVPNTPCAGRTELKRRVVRSECPKLEHHGNMSNLRPDDQGMDDATCVELYRVSVPPKDQVPLANTDDDNDSNVSNASNASNDSDASTPNRTITWDLGARFANRSPPEQKARCRAKSREFVNEEAAASKHDFSLTTGILDDANEEISDLSRGIESTGLDDDTGDTDEESIDGENGVAEGDDDDLDNGDGTAAEGSIDGEDE